LRAGTRIAWLGARRHRKTIATTPKGASTGRRVKPSSQDCLNPQSAIVKRAGPYAHTPTSGSIRASGGVLHRAQGQCGRLSEALAVASHLIVADHGYPCTSSFDDAVTTLTDLGRVAVMKLMRSDGRRLASSERLGEGTWKRQRYCQISLDLSGFKRNHRRIDFIG